MKGTSSLTLLGLVGVVGLLPHNTLALPAEHHNTTSTSSGDGGVMTMQSCVVKPGWWIGCCDHKTDSNLGDGGDCKDYSEKELNINKIGDCEKDSAGRSGDRGQFSLPS